MRTRLSSRMCLLVMLAATAGVANAQSRLVTFSLKPANPTDRDAITVSARYEAGPYVDTRGYEIDGARVFVRFVQDGFDFGPNPPHGASVVVPPLPAGRYEFVVSSIRTVNDPPIVDGFDVVVSGSPIATSVPATSTVTVMALIASLLVCIWVHRKRPLDRKKLI